MNEKTISVEVIVDERIRHKFRILYDNEEHEFFNSTTKVNDIANQETIIPIIYMKNRVNINIELINLLDKGGKDVSDIFYYICKNIPYNSNTIILKGTILSKLLNLAPQRISKALKFLKENKILIQANSIDIYKDKNFDNSVYIVNVDYVYNASIKEVYEQMEKQRQMYETRQIDESEEIGETSIYLKR